MSASMNRYQPLSASTTTTAPTTPSTTAGPGMMPATPANTGVGLTAPPGFPQAAAQAPQLVQHGQGAAAPSVWNNAAGTQAPGPMAHPMPVNAQGWQHQHAQNLPNWQGKTNSHTIQNPKEPVTQNPTPPHRKWNAARKWDPNASPRTSAPAIPGLGSLVATPATIPQTPAPGMQNAPQSLPPPLQQQPAGGNGAQQPNENAKAAGLKWPEQTPQR
ncbi:hypothetical protein NLI96_g12417 [Meripilus lineatus]|uniref:Uncharacterized protein n=1 Tax=Meripilus lineatus TaxID=2056292 RepID=A0AAD5UQ20_9APHY|nr:hypothetical protein NLI96_g12417 [Physisporinus lineatus]